MPVRWLAISAGVAGVLYALDGLLLRFEEHGWIYYRKRKASPGKFSSAFLSAVSLLDPSARHVVEARRQARSEADERGDPPEPGNGSEQG